MDNSSRNHGGQVFVYDAVDRTNKWPWRRLGRKWNSTYIGPQFRTLLFAATTTNNERRDNGS
jgi:hypothetical protein